MESATKKKLGTTLGGLTAVAAAVGLTAGSFAYFSDSESTDTQDVEAGSLSLGSSYSNVVDATNLAPGDETEEQTIRLENEGDLDGQLRVQLHRHSGNTSLAEALEVKIDGPVGSGGDWVALEDAEDHHVGLGALKSGEDAEFTVQLRFPDTGEDQNHLQGKSLEEMVEADLVQGDEEEDGPDFQAPES